MAALINISHLDFAYGDQLVLKHIDLPVEQGTTLGVIGPNGGGKTTLIRLMLGLLMPTRGSIEIDGMPPDAAVRRGDLVGYLPQNPKIPSNFPISVRQVARLGLAGQNLVLPRRMVRRYELAGDGAVQVASIDRAGPAARAGLEQGDIIVGFAGQPVAGFDDLHRLLTEEKLGGPVPVVVLRRGRRLTFDIRPDESS